MQQRRESSAGWITPGEICQVWKLENLTKAQVLKTLVGALGYEFGRPIAYFEFPKNQAGKIGGCQAEAHIRVINGCRRFVKLICSSPSFQHALVGLQSFHLCILSFRRRNMLKQVSHFLTCLRNIARFVGG